MACQVCGNDSQRRKKKRINSPKSIFKADILICDMCGHGVIETIPTEKEISDYYNRQYWHDGGRFNTIDKSREKNEYWKSDRANAQLEIITKFCTNPIKNILEIGSGAANISQLIRHYTGSEIDVCEAGKEWGEFYEANKINHVSKIWPFDTDKKYDLIIASHWLEHTTNLRDTIKRMHNLLNDNGSVFVEVPNTGGDYWNRVIGCSPHIHFFTHKSIFKAFNQKWFTAEIIANYGCTQEEYFEKLGLDKQGINPKGRWIRAIFRKH